MEQQKTPFEPRSSADPSALSKPSDIAGFRKLSDGILASAVLARREDRPEVSKTELARTLKRAATALGIKCTSYRVLDILLGLVRPDSFAAGKRPVVAISNERLAAYVSVSQRSVSRALKQLVEAGVLAYRDSPTGKRYVTGKEAYGLDFTPACFNLADFAKLADQFQEGLDRKRRARRQVTALSRAIVDLVEQGGPDFAEHVVQAKQLVEQLGHDPQVCAEWLQALYDDVLMAVENRPQHRDDSNGKKPANQPEITSAGDTAGAHYTNTIQPPFVRRTVTDKIRNSHTQAHASQNGELKEMRTCSYEQDIEFAADNGCAVEMALEKEPGGAATQRQQLNQQAENPKKEAGGSKRISPIGGTTGKPWPQDKERDGKSGGQREPQTHGQKERQNPPENLSGVSAKLISAACKNIQNEIGPRLASWDDITKNADTLRVFIGLSKAAYTKAVINHGKFLPAACLAVVAEKALRDPAQISSPGGYFCAMVDRANDRKLNLTKSLRALANETT